MKLTSAAFEDGAGMPRKHTGDGADVSPPLEWKDVPGRTRAFALFMRDHDAPEGSAVHWILYDLPHTTAALPEGILKQPKTHEGAGQGRNDFGIYGYTGPAPPSGRHRYVFELLALDAYTGLEPGAGRDAVRKAAEGHVLERAVLAATCGP